LPYVTGAAIETYASWFVSQVQAIDAAVPSRSTLYTIDNEVWNFYSPAATAAQYADVVVAVLNAAASAGLDLTRIYPQIKDASWVPAMYVEQPTLGTLVEGWDCHPYGPPPPGYASSTGQGIASLPTLRQTVTSGADNIIVSEIGFTDQSVLGAPSSSIHATATSTQAAEWLSDLLEQAAAYRAAGWLRALLVYHRTADGYAMVEVNTNGTLTQQGQALIAFNQRMRPNANSGYAPRTPGIWLPYDDGLFAATMDPAAAHDAVQLVASRIHFFRVRVDVFDFASRITVWLDTGGTLTSGQCFAGIYQQQLASGAGSYVLQEATSDQAAAWTAGQEGRKMMSLSGQSYLPGYYWIALLANGSVMPKFRGVSVGSQWNLGNFGVLPQRVMQSQGTYTSLPSSLDLSSGATVSGTAFTSGILAALN
jgi:hypothetical protein